MLQVPGDNYITGCRFGTCDLKRIFEVGSGKAQGIVDLMVAHGKNGNTVKQGLKDTERFFTRKVLPENISDVCKTEDGGAVPDLLIPAELEDLLGIFSSAAVKDGIKNDVGIKKDCFHLFKRYASLSSSSKSFLDIFPASAPWIRSTSGENVFDKVSLGRLSLLSISDLKPDST